MKVWMKREFVPDRYMFEIKAKGEPSGLVKKFIGKLDGKMSADDIHQMIFENAKENSVQPKELFKEIYLWLIGKEHGPKASKLIYAIGVNKLKKDIGG